MSNKHIVVSALVLTTILLAACSSRSPSATTPSPPPPTATQPPTRTPSSTPTSPPTPTPSSTPTPSPTPIIVHIEADGSGDYATLKEGIQNAPENATVLLGPGTYQLDELLVIDGMPYISKPLHLVGAGPDETEIVSDGTGYVIRFDGEGPFIIEDIAFRHEGNHNAHTVVVSGGDATFIRCRFSGATDTNMGGLLFSNDATGLVQDSEALENYHGFLVLQEAQVVIEDSACTSNISGITYGDNAGGTIRRNNCSDNTAGIAISPSARPVVEENTCTNNRVGIAYNGIEETIEGAAGIARGNICRENQLGIAVTYAHPRLEDNICSDNSEVGISLSEGAGGVVVDNECARNGRAGILIVEDVDPDLEILDNRCYDNEEVDIDDQR